MSGKKSRAASPLDEATVERTLVSSMDITTAPLANRAILPVSKVIDYYSIVALGSNTGKGFYFNW